MPHKGATVLPLIIILVISAITLIFLKITDLIQWDLIFLVIVILTVLVILGSFRIVKIQRKRRGFK